MMRFSNSRLLEKPRPHEVELMRQYANYQPTAEDRAEIEKFFADSRKAEQVYQRELQIESTDTVSIRVRS